MTVAILRRRAQDQREGPVMCSHRIGDEMCGSVCECAMILRENKCDIVILRNEPYGVTVSVAR